MTPVDPDLSPDPLVEVLTQETPEPDVVAIVGFVGRAPSGDVRFFLDPELKVWLDIPVRHVRHRQRLPEEEGTVGARSVIWVAGEWMRRPMFDQEQLDALAEEFLIGSFALSLVLPATVADAVEDMESIRTRRCPTIMCTPRCQ
jgi:hypothetical protein